MSWDKLPTGKNVPEEVYAVIENPLGGEPVKYEIDKETGLVFVDRFLHTCMFYPGNYGFVPHTLSGDGDPVDVLVIGRTPVMPGCVMRVKPIAVLLMEDDGGMDEKIIARPIGKLHPYHENVNDLDDIRPILKEQIEHFFTHYKDLEKGKWAKTLGWEGADRAKQLILDGVERAQKSQEAA